MFHLLLWGSLPTNIQRTQLSETLARYMGDVPPIVHRAIQILPYVIQLSENFHRSFTHYFLLEEQLLPCHCYLQG
jgi:citrate synthase